MDSFRWTMSNLECKFHYESMRSIIFSRCQCYLLNIKYVIIGRKLYWSSVLVKCFLKGRKFALIHVKGLFVLLRCHVTLYNNFLSSDPLFKSKLWISYLCSKPWWPSFFFIWKNKIVSFCLLQGEEGLVHFQWLDRTRNVVEDVSYLTLTKILCACSSFERSIMLFICL